MGIPLIPRRRDVENCLSKLGRHFARSETAREVETPMTLFFREAVFAKEGESAFRDSGVFVR
jgi:hypothetical protein